MRLRRAAALVVALVTLLGCSPDSPTSPVSPTSPTPPSADASSPTSPPATSSPARPPAGADWTTFGHDSQRSGSAPDGPASASLRRSWVSPRLDGDIYAQPLPVGKVVLAATENDTLYALDAASGTVVWQQHFGEPVSGDDLPCGNVDPVGITSTPVVDASAGRVYAVGMVRLGRHELVAVDLGTGRLLFRRPVDAPGADPQVHNQRAALTLANGRIYVPFGGRLGDCGDYHGRVVSVAAAGGGDLAAYQLPTTREGGFWAPPGAVIDAAGSLLLTSGNSESEGRYDYGNSVVRLTPDLRLADWFAPRDWAQLNAGDTDLGSTSPVLLEGSRVFQIGKAGVGYLLDAGHLGGLGGDLHHEQVCDGPVFGASAREGPTLYVPCPEGLLALRVDGGRFTRVWRSAVRRPGPPSVSRGLVWVVDVARGNLHALDAATGTSRLTEPVGDPASRFTSPAVGGGRVVVAASRRVVAVSG